MRSSLLALLLAAVSPSLAIAQDGDWTGAYVGAHLGFGAFDKGDNSVCTTVCVAAVNEAPDAIETYGAFGGYLVDLGAYVIGAELDYGPIQIGLVDLNGGAKTSPSDGIDGTMTRAKLIAGYDAGSILPYATIGLGQLSIDGGGNTDATILGLGAVYRISDSLRVGAEVLHHDFDTPVGPALAGTPLSQATTVSLRVSFAF